MKQKIFYIFISILVFSCGQTESTRVIPIQHQEGVFSSSSQKASLETVFYQGNPMPPQPTDAELETARTRFLQKISLGERAKDQELLRKLFGSVFELWVYAMRDTDGDGIKDFRVSEHYGKFYEGDIDIDGDGIRNVIDQNPYDPRIGFVDRNRNFVADTVDWEFDPEKIPFLKSLQRDVYQKYGVLMVDRSSKVDLKLAEAFIDVIDMFLGADTILASRVLSVLTKEHSLMISPGVPEDGDSSGYILSQLQTMTIYDTENDYPAFLTLGLVAHELAHVVQMGMDFSSHGPFDENRKPYTQMPNFFLMMESFGWQTRWNFPEHDYRWLKPHFQDAQIDYSFQGRTVEEWKSWIEQRYQAEGEDYLDGKEARDLHLIGDYSMVDPLEWHSDHFMAYVFIEIEQLLLKNCANRGWVMKRFQSIENGPLKEHFPWFRYRNSFDSEIYRHFKKRFPLKKVDHRTWLRKYFGFDFDIHCEWGLKTKVFRKKFSRTRNH